MRAQINWSAEQRVYTLTALLIIIVAFAARAHALLVSSIHWDESVYLVTAQRWLLGELPYVAVWDQHPPGLPALLAIAQVIIPDPVLGARLAATFATMITALLIHRFCVRYLGRPGAGLVGALLYIFCISRWLGLAANTEIFNNACVTLASYLLYGAVVRVPFSVFRAVAGAAMLGVGLQIKYVVLPEAVILCLGYLVALYQRNRNLGGLAGVAAMLIAAGSLPTGAVVIYFWSHGELQAFLDANVGANIAYLGVVPTLSEAARSSANGMAPLLGSLAVIGYTLARCIRWRSKLVATLSPEVWILVWSMAAILNVCLPLKFFNHYYFALYPPVCLAGAFALSVAARNRSKNFAAGLAILFVTAIPLWALGETRAARSADADAPRIVAEFLQQAGAEDTNVFVYDYDPVIYALARLRPPTPYVLGSEFDEFSFSSQIDGAAEVRRVMDALPDYVVVHQRQPGGFIPAALDDIMTLRLAAYHLVFQTENGVDGAIVRIYRRQL